MLSKTQPTTDHQLLNKLHSHLTALGKKHKACVVSLEINKTRSSHVNDSKIKENQYKYEYQIHQCLNGINEVQNFAANKGNLSSKLMAYYKSYLTLFNNFQNDLKSSFGSLSMQTQLLNSTTLKNNQKTTTFRIHNLSSFVHYLLLRDSILTKYTDLLKQKNTYNLQIAATKQPPSKLPKLFPFHQRQQTLVPKTITTYGFAVADTKIEKTSSLER